MSPLASIQNLTVTGADGSMLLDGIDLELTPGTVTGIVGPSGAGKTTLAHALLGHLGPGLHRVSGTVRVHGLDPFTSGGRRALRGRIIGYVPQDPASALNPRRRIVAQLRTTARIAHPGEPGSALTDRITAAARAATLDLALLRRHPERLSGGQAQRVLLSWALITRPRVIVLDEPTSGLDLDTAAEIATTFTALPWRPAILLISHDPVLVARMADRTFTIAAGCLQPAPQQRSAPAVPRSPAPPPTGVFRRLAQRETALSVVNLTVSHGEWPVIDRASFALAPAELLALRGVSGSGKTSLARALAGLAPPAAGSLHLHGAALGWDAAARARSGGPFLAYVGQDARAALNPHESVHRTLHRALAVAGRSGRPTRWGLDELLDRFELDPQLLRRTSEQLSGGQRHRLALARAVAAAPDVLLCDESPAALATATEQRVLDTLDRFRRDSGTPILLITHRDRVANRADRLLTLVEGRLQ